jgi:hypothetical protein
MRTPPWDSQMHILLILEQEIGGSSLRSMCKIGEHGGLRNLQSQNFVWPWPFPQMHAWSTALLSSETRSQMHWKSTHKIDKATFSQKNWDIGIKLKRILDRIGPFTLTETARFWGTIFFWGGDKSDLCPTGVWDLNANQVPQNTHFYYRNAKYELIKTQWYAT